MVNLNTTEFFFGTLRRPSVTRVSDEDSRFKYILYGMNNESIGDARFPVECEVCAQPVGLGRNVEDRDIDAAIVASVTPEGRS